MKIKIHLLCSFLCLYRVICVELENLCRDDFFNYKGYLVNAFHRVDQISDLPAVKQLIIEEWSTFNYFTNKTRYPDSDLRGEMEQIKWDVKHRIKAIYSEYYLNGPEFYRIQTQRKYFDSIWERLESVKNRTDPADLTRFLEILRGVQGRPEKLISYLLPFQVNQFQPYDMYGLMPNKYAMMETLRQILKDLYVSVNQSLAFENDFIEEIYKQPIVSRPKFTFNRMSKVLYDTTSYGTLRYQIVLPFANALYDYSRPCVPSSDLPRFFSSRKKS